MFASRVVSLVARSIAGVSLIVALNAAHATPVAYTMTFDASDTAAGALGSNGTGSFLWDAATSLMTDLRWDFGGGLTGGYTDAFLAITFPNISPFLFTGVLTRTGDPTQGGSSVVVPPALSQYLIGPFPQSAGFCWGLNSPVFCHMSDLGGVASYEFIGMSATGAPVTYRGAVTVAVTTPTTGVPEPGTVALVGLAGVALAVTRRRRA